MYDIAIQAFHHAGVTKGHMTRTYFYRAKYIGTKIFTCTWPTLRRAIILSSKTYGNVRKQFVVQGY